MRKIYKKLLFLSIFFLSLYGLGRLYFHLTGGFAVGHITSDFPFQPQWEVRSILPSEEALFLKVIQQPYYYLSKGCQSYVFESQDGKYVIKFFKYQRYRLQPWLAYFPPLPALVKYRQEKLEKKWKKLDSFVKSWKVAFENLKDETGLLFVHLNKTTNLSLDLTLYDKIGQKHVVSLDQMEFCVQHNAQMLCDTLLDQKQAGQFVKSKLLIHQLLAVILSEYARGLADNDHALMQNTGVAEGKPIHIDVGQFVFNEKMREPKLYHQELFNKTYKFNLWLKENYPELGEHLDNELFQIIGPEYLQMKPQFRKK